MKCKFCGYDISETDTKCPGCDKEVEVLKNEGNIIYEESETDSVDSGVMVGEAVTLKDELAEKEAESILEPVTNEPEVTEPTSEVVEEVKDVMEPVVITDKFKKKSGIKVFILILVIILLLAAAGFGYMYFVYTSPANIFKKMYANLLNNLPANKGNSVTVDYTNSKLEGYTINSVNYISDDNIVSNIKVSGNDLMLDTNILKTSSELFFYESNIYDKYVQINEDKIVSEDSFRILNVILHRNELVNIIKNIDIENYINTDALTKEFTTITHDQKNMGATKVSYTNAKANTVITKLLLAIRDNKSNLEALANILNMTTENTIVEINNLITSMNNSNYNVSIDLYTDYITNSYYKLDINVKNNEHNLTINVEFSDNKIKEIKVTYDATYIYITNNMETISVNNNDVTTTYTYKFGNETLTYPTIEEPALYDDVASVIDANISNNEAIKKFIDAINGNVPEKIEEPLPSDIPLDVIPEPTLDTTIDNINE